MMLRVHHGGLATIGAIVVLMLLFPLGALAQDSGIDLVVRDTRLAEDGTTEIIVNVAGNAAPGMLDTSAFTVTEQGEEVAVEVTPLLSADASVDVAVGLALDASGSLIGAPEELMKEAAADLAAELALQGVLVQVVSFASDVTPLTPLTSNPDTLVSAIEGIRASGATLLYDAIVQVSGTLAGFDGQRNLVVFSDGEDNGSAARLPEAIAAAEDADATVYAVALEPEDEVFDLSALESIVAETDGQLLYAEDATQLAGLFETVASSIASQYVLHYQGEPTELPELQLSVAVSAGGSDDQVTYAVANTRDAPPAEAVAPRVVPAQPPGFFAQAEMLYVGLAAAFVALLLIFAMMFSARRTRAEKVLSDQLATYLEGRDARAGRSSDVAAYFRSRALELLEATPRPKGFDEKLTARLEQANWPMRPGEFLALSILSGLATLLVVTLLFNVVGGLLLGIFASLIPTAILSIRRSKRQAAFLENLPDTLQLMAGSLRAGYGVLQAIDTVSKEAQEPISHEFTRVLTEARLGMPVEDALHETAERIDSDDFRWVVLAINIQREVGGNLAELLDLVADVLREREMLRRQIKVLSAEGRLSAIVLIALPFFLIAYMILVRPEYIGTLVTSGLFGWLMIGTASLLMLVGIFWIRKLIQIEV